MSKDNLSNWKIFEQYLVETRYAVRDPETNEPLEHTYQDVLERISQKLIKELPKYLITNLYDKNSTELYDYKLEYYTILTQNLIQALKDRLFIPATPFLMSYANEYTRRPGLFSCYPLGYVEDTMDDIWDKCKLMRNIYMYGGGSGIDISQLRSQGKPVDKGQGIASGPIEFLKLFDAVAGSTNQGGRRRGALLVSMDADHPNIYEFIKCKKLNGKLSKFFQTLDPEERPAQNPHLSNMNISVNVHDKDFDNEELIQAIAESIWSSGDPGLLFPDNMIKNGPFLKEDDPIFVNPCAEYSAPANTSCNLLTINIAKILNYTTCKSIEEGIKTLRKVVEYATILGNFIIDQDYGYPDEKIKENTQKFKPIGIGMSGFYTALISWYMLSPTKNKDILIYGSEDSCQILQFIQSIITFEALRQSSLFALNTNIYSPTKHDYWNAHIPKLYESLIKILQKYTNLFTVEEYETMINTINYHTDYLAKHTSYYNSVLTSQAPTGTVSIFLNNLDTGIEPYFSYTQSRRVRDVNESSGWKIFDLESPYLEALQEDLKDQPELYDLIQQQTATNIDGIKHLNVLYALTSLLHTGVSKTLNLKASTTVEDIKKILYDARHKGVKGLTIYRDGSLDNIISSTSKKDVQKQEEDIVTQDIGVQRSSIVYTVKGLHYTAHISLTYDESYHIREVFIQAGDIGSDMNTLFTGLGMSISLALRNNPNIIDRYIKTLQKVRMDDRLICKVPDLDKPIIGSSLPNIVGQLLDHTKTIVLSKFKNSFYESEQSKMSISTKPMDSKIQLHSVDICPECKEITLIKSGSCFKCSKCGYSSC
jgi:ribonucleoside-diphosphate reductase alpha chain